LPTSSTTLPGSGSDPDGSIQSYLWKKNSGPTCTLLNTDQPTATINDLLEGTYYFKLSVRDDFDALGTDIVKVTVIAGNQQPSVNAGDDQSLTLPTSSTNLTASASDADGTISSYLWQEVSGPSTPTITSESSATCSVSGLTTEGTYTFSITVEDNEGSSALDEVSVIISAEPVNTPPSVNAGDDQYITLPVNDVTLSGSASDSDGSIASYLWSKTSGGTATLSGSTTNTLEVSDLVAGSYRFKLTATDDDGDTSSDDVDVIVSPEDVNESPSADAGGNQSITLPTNSITLNGSATDADGTIASYSWQKKTGGSCTLTGASTSDLLIEDLADGSYSFELTVTDDDGATGSDIATVTVSAANVAPTVDAGPDIDITLPTNSVSITGTASDPDGTVENWVWSQITGPSTADVDFAFKGDLTVSSLIAGLYMFKLTVTDNEGLTGFDVVEVTVNQETNNHPSSNAGEDKSITLPISSINLTGSAIDSDGTISSTDWALESGPGSPVLTNDNTLTLSVSDLVEGQYTFSLTVIDEDGGSDYDEVIVTVNAEDVNSPPIASAGTNTNITLPTNMVVLTGSGSDADGTISTYLWEKTSGPPATLSNETTATLTASELTEGIYMFRLTVTDNDGDQDSDVVTVSVTPEDVNQPPVANAGTDINIQLPTNSVTIFGSGSDSDGSIQSYLWDQTDGTTTTIDNETTATLTVSGLAEGTYDFQLTVIDNEGAQGTDQVTVTVIPEAANQAPVANAGDDIELYLPTNSTSISGSGSDADGSIISYSWIKLSGPDVTMSNENTAVLAVSNLVEGTYEFRLTVVDDDDASSIDKVKVTVFTDAVNEPPVVDAGSDQSIVLPENSITLTGTASDVDGSISSIEWIKISGGTATMEDETTNTLKLSNLEEGTYHFYLTAIDDDNASTSDEVVVTVLPEETNQPPSAFAGQDQSINLPTNSVTLTGSGSDPDGTIVSYLWSKSSGPNATLQNTDSESLSVSNMVEGVYTFKLTITDDDGDIGDDLIEVSVIPESINIPPTVNAGSNRTIQLPENQLDIEGTATDDGTIVTVSWIKTSGADGVSMSGQDTNTLSLSNLTEGEYTFEFSAVDDGDLTSSDDISVVVLAEEPVIPNESPTVDAGEDVTLELPDSIVVLTAFGEDPEGLVEYLWEQVLGPNDATIDSASSHIITITNFVAGIYVFNVTVTDMDGESASDEVTVTVIGEEEETPDELVAPRIFSPNNDGFDDFWVIDNNEDISECKLIIFNRQGTEMFSIVGYQNTWDGTNKKGESLPEGVYYYVIRCTNKTNTYSGSITLIR